MAMPAKFKIGVSGCPNSCGESWLKDLGFLGTVKGFKVLVGGEAGKTPRIGRELAGGLNVEQCKTLAEKIMQYYRSNAQPRERMGNFIERIGFENFQKEMIGEVS
jgi:NAD(P)H-nitrite reductase large subunit